jgi:hypothetical protein
MIQHNKHDKTQKLKTMDTFSLEQLTAVKQILQDFYSNIQWQILIAPMQSGKSEVYLLVLFESIRLERVKRGIIMSGNSDIQLKRQTDFNLSAFGSSFLRKYQNYLLGSESSNINETIRKIKQKIEIVWGKHEIKKHVPNKVDTLIIWEESHYAQSQKQGPDMFFDKYKICTASGKSQSPSHFVLSVSATPYSEMANHLNPDNIRFKSHCTLVPGANYNSVENMVSSGRLHFFKDWKQPLQEVAQITTDVSKYCLIRTTKTNDNYCSHLMAQHGWRVLHFDSEFPNAANETEWNEMNEGKEPEVNTCFIIKQKCSMGKNLNKEHISFLFETRSSSKTTNTDTVLQGFLGRACGYNKGSDTVHVYISIEFKHEIEKYIRGEYNLKAMNTRINNNTIEHGIALAPVKIRIENVRLRNHNRATLLQHLIDHPQLITCEITREIFIQSYYETTSQIKIATLKKMEQEPETVEKLNRFLNTPCMSMGKSYGFTEGGVTCRIYITSVNTIVMHCRNYDIAVASAKVSLPLTTKREITYDSRDP